MAGHDQQVDRVGLMRALVELGLDPIELEEQGSKQVALPVMDDTGSGTMAEGMRPEITGYMEQASEQWHGSTTLYVVLEGDSYPARIGVRGQSGESGEPYRSEEWKDVHSQEEAVEAFNRLWSRRDEFFGSLSNSND